MKNPDCYVKRRLDNGAAVGGGVRNTSPALGTTTTDKIVFTVFTFGLIASGFLAGSYPNYYYIFYSVESVILLTCRYRLYKKKNDHYFLFDFCYFAKLLTFLYLWGPFSDSFRGALFPVVFGFSHGPLLGSVVLWRNSIVPHSTDKMTNVFVHVSPAVSLWGIRWFSTNEQGFPLCGNPTVTGLHGCDHIGVMERLYRPMLTYLIWQATYIAVIFYWRKERIKERSYNTAYLYLADVTNNKKGMLYSMCWVLGPRYCKPLYMAWHCVYTLGSMIITYPAFHHKTFSVVLVAIMLLVAAYNGATYYMEKFSSQLTTTTTTTSTNEHHY